MITWEYEKGIERCYLNGASTNEDCESLIKYFQKYWDAEVREIYDVGSDAKYELIIGGFGFNLIHHSQLGNFLTSGSGSVKGELKDVIADLDRRLSQD